MADQLPFCINCGAQQSTVDARFCHRCGRPIVPTTKSHRKTTPWLALALFTLVVAVVAGVVLAHRPVRQQLASPGGSGQPSLVPTSQEAKAIEPTMTGPKATAQGTFIPSPVVTTPREAMTPVPTFTRTSTPPSKEITSTPSALDAEVRVTLTAWAQALGLPFRDTVVEVRKSDGFFATVRVVAWFRPTREDAWEEREAEIECRQVGGQWQCEQDFTFVITAGERARRTEAIVTKMPAHLRTLHERFGVTFVQVPAGEFLMGSSNQHEGDEAKPQHPVYLDGYWIMRTEVSNAMYAHCVKTRVCEAPGNTKSNTRMQYYGDPKYDNYPVIYVSWYDALKYCTWLGGRLPTEAEWEKAARGIDGRDYPWGNQPDSQYPGLDLRRVETWDTTTVDEYLAGASPYGVLEMAGNVWEWVADWYDRGYYGKSPDRNPTGPDMGTDRVTRGGMILYYGVYITLSTSRRAVTPEDEDYYIGFRCAMSQ